MPWGKGGFEVSVLSSWGQRTDSLRSYWVLCGDLKLSLSVENKTLKYLQAGIGWPSQNLTPVSPQVPNPEYSENHFSKPHLQGGTMVVYEVFGLLCN